MRRAPERCALALALGLAALAPAYSHAADLGTLFHTAEEREKLDRQRRGEPGVPMAQPTRPQSANEVTGFVRRSDGKNTVWIDGRPIATSNPRNTLLLDPRLVNDLPPDPAIKITPERRPR